MALVTEKSAVAFDMTQIERGYLLWGRHYSWKEGKSGFVISVTEKQLIVQYYPGVSNVTNHFIIPVFEVVAGQWEIRWSCDMAEIQEYNICTDNERRKEEGAESDDPGKIDL